MGSTVTKETDVNDGSTDRMIRSLMVEQKRVHSRRSLPDLEPVDPEMEPTDIETPKDKPKKKKIKRSRESGGIDGLKARILAYRPTKKHIFLAALALVMVLRPWLIPGLLFVTFWVALIAWLTLGPDRVTEMLQNGWERLSRRRPQLAERLRGRADVFALKFDALLDKLPEKWAEKLALPDLSSPVAQDADLDAQPDPFERLKLPEVYRG